jgi:hypothetical protein
MQEKGKRTLAEIAYPHGETIASAVGTPVPGKAVLDPDGCRERNVPAFTDKLVTHFGSETPTLHVAAHEAAHLLQHAGTTRDGGLGAEGHAHQVADAVTTGSAQHLIGDDGATIAAGVRDYTEISEDEQVRTGHWKTAGTSIVGEAGRTVTSTESSKSCYADPALITEANAILKTKGSGVNIEPGGPGPVGMAPDGSGFKTTVKVKYNILGDDKNEEYYADCGRAARETMGKAGADHTAHGVYKDATGNKARTRASGDPEDFRNEIYIKGGLGTTGRTANAAYNALDANEKEAFDKKHGINKYAAPNIGEAFTRRRDDSVGQEKFNFHWGGVIMVTGDDRVTFENYAKDRNYDRKDADWYFGHYGTKSGQTFHERWHNGVGGRNGAGTTMVGATSADPTPFMDATKKMTTAALIERYPLVTGGEQMALEAAMRQRWLKVTVKVKESQEDEDEVYVVAEHGGKSYESKVKDLNTGGTGTFWVPLDHFAPVTGPILVKVYEEDDVADDLISIVDFAAPFTPRSDNRPEDGAEYHTRVEFDR